MTVETTDRKQNFDGGQADLEFTFRALPEAPEDIKCIATSDAGAITDLEYGVEYTVAVNSDGIGGTVTVNPTFATTYTHTVYRETTIKQESDYDDYNPFPADTLETNIDRLTMIAQEERELGERTLKYPISATGTDTNLPVPEAGKFIAWNAAGDGMENKDIPDPSTLIKASQAEAEAGTDNDNFMTPLRTKQAIDELQDDDIPLSYISTSGTLAENSDTKVASQKATKTYADTKLPSSYLDTDGDLTANSDVKVPSQKAVKTYVDEQISDVNDAIADIDVELITHEAGTTHTLASADTEQSTTSTSYTKKKEIEMAYGGVVRVTWLMWESSNLAPVYAKVYVNGAAVGDEKSISVSTPTLFTSDVTVERFDKVQLYIKATSGRTCRISQFRVKSLKEEFLTTRVILD